MIRQPRRVSRPLCLSIACLLGSVVTPAVAQTADSTATGPAVALRSPTVPPAVIAVPVPVPLPLPGQLKPLVARAVEHPVIDPKFRIIAANAAARVQPVREGFLNAIQQYPWTEGALYQLYTAPGQVTDIALQEGEQLVGPGPVAAGDTVRWIIGDTISGAGITARVHIMVKPTRFDLVTNLVINTDRRTYHLELRATPATYMASVSWTYPQDDLIALRGRTAAAAAIAPVATGLDVTQLAFGYRIDGDRPAWRPVRAFDDGRQVFVEFPAAIAQGDMPPLFVIGASGEGELVNYRVQGRFMVVDRLFDVAELRLGDRKGATAVRILRGDAATGKARK